MLFGCLWVFRDVWPVDHIAQEEMACLDTRQHRTGGEVTTYRQISSNSILFSPYLHLAIRGVMCVVTCVVTCADVSTCVNVSVYQNTELLTTRVELVELCENESRSHEYYIHCVEMSGWRRRVLRIWPVLLLSRNWRVK